MPRNVFDELRDTLDSLPNRFTGTGLSTHAGESGLVGRISGDVSEDENAFIVTADLPGFEQEDINVTVRIPRDRLRSVRPARSSIPACARSDSRRPRQRPATPSISPDGGLVPDRWEPPKRLPSTASNRRL